MKENKGGVFMKKTILSLILIWGIMNILYAQDAKEIIKQVDNNLVYDTIKFNGELDVYTGTKHTVKTFSAYGKGSKNSFNVFTNPEDTGTKYLKKDGNLYVYQPDLEEVVPIVGHLLKQSMMGSDMSYEDIINNDTLDSQYISKITGEEEVNGRKCWIIELTAKDKTVSYQKRIMWVDKEIVYPIKTELYAVSGKKLKEQEVLEIQKIGNRYFPVVRQMKDLLRKSSKTIIKFTNIEMDIKIPDSMFSMKNLEK